MELPRGGSGDALADRFLAALNKTSRLLASNPRLGRLSRFESLAAISVRQLPVDRPFQHWLLFYTASETGIVVFRVVHGTRDLPELFA